MAGKGDAGADVGEVKVEDWRAAGCRLDEEEEERERKKTGKGGAFKGSGRACKRRAGTGKLG